MTIEELKMQLREILPLASCGRFNGEIVVTIEKVFKAIELLEGMHGDPVFPKSRSEIESKD